LVIVVFVAHDFPELLFTDLFSVFLPDAPDLYPGKENPAANGDGEVWKRVGCVKRAKHGAGRDQAGEDKKEECFHGLG
jgi:hypothetical protein